MIVLALSLMTAGTALAQSGGLVVKDAWARATPGGADTGAAYATIVSSEPPTAWWRSRLRSPRAVQLHSMSMEGAVMRMRPVAAIDIPAGQPVMLKPGGLHIMLDGLNQPLREKQTFPLTLSFEKAGPQQVTVTVEKGGLDGGSDARDRRRDADANAALRTSRRPLSTISSGMRGRR